MTDALNRCNVEWTSPSANSAGSMPLGNGDIGLNVWVEEDGDLLFYIGKTDAWSETARLLKLGRVRVTITPNPFCKGMPFQQTLKLHEAEIEIRAGRVESEITVRVWIDANNPVVRVEAESPQIFEMKVALESWRLQPRTLETTREIDSAYGLGDGPIVVDPDTILPNQPNRVVWYHRNTRSIWADTLNLQGLGGRAKMAEDPLLNRTFGGVLCGDGLMSQDSVTLKSANPAGRFTFSIHLLTKQTETSESWLHEIAQQITRVDVVPLNTARAKHREWWGNFWRRSWVFVSGTPEAETVTRGYTLQRFINACGGRGAFPIKFNGSIFTVDAREPNETFDPDYRRWGGPYWFQNTRLTYWPMIASGDDDLLQRLFRMYLSALPLAKERTRLFFGHGGAFFPETMYFWGAYTNQNYGSNRGGKPASFVENQYIRYLWQGGLELCAMMLDHHAHARDEHFLKSTLLPFAESIVEFYDQHYPRDEHRKLRIAPASALETWNEAVNPTPEVAGLTCVLDRLLALPGQSASQKSREIWHRLRGEVPALAMRTEAGKTFLLPAAEFSGRQNSENPELYAVFPYRFFCVGGSDLEIGRETFARRADTGSGGWVQNAIQAALLGLGDEARRCVIHNFATHHAGSRFPAFWGPNADWIPDQDHGSVAVMALQCMLLQSVGEKIILLPAWPREWDVDFKLHAPGNTTVEGRYRSGKLEWFSVTPTVRTNDVTLTE